MCYITAGYVGRGKKLNNVTFRQSRQRTAESLGHRRRGRVYSRLRVRCFVALEGVQEVVFVVHVAMRAQIVVEAHLAFPTHSHDAMLLTAVADDVRVPDTYERRQIMICAGKQKHLCVMESDKSYKFASFVIMTNQKRHFGRLISVKNADLSGFCYFLCYVTAIVIMQDFGVTEQAWSNHHVQKTKKNLESFNNTSIHRSAMTSTRPLWCVVGCGVGPPWIVFVCLSQSMDARAMMHWVF